jgi:hypothetical protein
MRVYKVVAEQKPCKSCKVGGMWTIEWTELTGEAPEQVRIGTAWGSKEFADDVCGLMNMAYDLGAEHAQ